MSAYTSFSINLELGDEKPEFSLSGLKTLDNKDFYRVLKINQAGADITLFMTDEMAVELVQVITDRLAHDLQEGGDK